MPESVSQLRNKWAKEKAKKEYLALPKAPRSMDTAPGYSGAAGKAIAARNKREFMKDARSRQARRAEQLVGAGQQQQQQRASTAAQAGLQRQQGQQALQRQQAAGRQPLAEIGAKGQQAIRLQQGKPPIARAKGVPGAMSSKQRADVESRLWKQYYDPEEGGKALRGQYGTTSEGGFMGFGAEDVEHGGVQKYIQDQMAKYQPAQLPQPAQTMAQPDMLQELPQVGGTRSFTTTGSQAQAVPSFGQQPVQSAQPPAVAPFSQVQPVANLPQFQPSSFTAAPQGAQWPQAGTGQTKSISPFSPGTSGFLGSVKKPKKRRALAQ